MNWGSIYSTLGRSRNKYAFYLGNYRYNDFMRGKIANMMPKPHLGWGNRAVSIRANKTHFDCFENDDLGFNNLLEEYAVIDAFDKIKEDILVCGCGFLALVGDRVTPFTAEEATGTFVWREQALSSGVAVFKNASQPTKLSVQTPPDSWVEFNGDSTVIHEARQEAQLLENPTGRPLISLLTYGATTKRPFGRTLLARPARDAILDASRTMRQAMVAAHYYNTKVDIILGVDSTTPVETVESQTGDILRIGANDNGQIPQIAEFAQHAMAPFNDTILAAARNFCAATKLNLNNIAISTDAPQSSESLEITGDDLKGDIKAWQEELGNQIKYFVTTLYMYKNELSDLDDNLLEKVRKIKPAWLPIYETDISKFGDGLNKVAGQMPGIVNVRSVWRSLGLTSQEIDALLKDNVSTDSLLA